MPMLYTEAVILGAVQGLTEFFPVSSSGHIFLAEHWMGLVPSAELSLWLHLGSLVAVVCFFWRDLWRMTIGLLQMIQEKTPNPYGVYTLKILLATLLTFPTAWAVREWFPYSELSLAIVGFTLIVTAGLIVMAEQFKREDTSLSWSIAIAVGLIQGLAVLPGISRSGLTIALLVWMGVSWQMSARTSFLLSIPTILGASFFSYLEQGERFINLVLFDVLAISSAIVSAYIAIMWMMKYLALRWMYFAYYCAFLGLVVMFM